MTKHHNHFSVSIIFFLPPPSNLTSSFFAKILVYVLTHYRTMKIDSLDPSSTKNVPYWCEKCSQLTGPVAEPTGSISFCQLSSFVTLFLGPTPATDWAAWGYWVAIFLHTRLFQCTIFTFPIRLVRALRGPIIILAVSILTYSLSFVSFIGATPFP